MQNTLQSAVQEVQKIVGHKFTMNPKIKTKVVHSLTKSAWNVIGDTPGGKFKIARVPYYTCKATINEPISVRNRKEAFDHAEFISYCFNNSDSICYKSDSVCCSGSAKCEIEKCKLR